MKKLFAATLLFFSAFIFAQDKFEVTYITRIILPADFEFQASGGRTMSKDMQDDFKKALQEPQENTLTVFGQQSFYKAVEKISNDQEASMGRSHMKFMRFGGDNIYQDLANGIYYKDLMISAKDYTIKDQLKPFDWKLTRETKTILGNEARKATLMQNDQELTVWYATKIPNKTGPENYWGLPGLILEIESPLDQGWIKGKRIITIGDIKPINNTKPIEALKVKKTITEVEFEKLKEEQRLRAEQMRNQGVETKN